MKKAIAFTLVLVLILGLTACGGKTETVRYEGTMTDLLEAIYEKASPEFSVMDPTPVDLTDEYALSYYTGLDDASLLSEAVASEAMMSAQAFSLCAMRVAEGNDPASVAQQVIDGVDPAKWICVTADDVRAVVCGDVIFLVMVSTDLSSTLGSDLVAAFTTTMGAEPQTTLTK